MIGRRSALAGLAGALAPALARGQGLEPAVLGIGVLTDTSGYGAGVSGMPQVVAVRQAIADAGPLPGERKVVLLHESYQRKPDDAVAIAGKWFDQGVAVVVDVPGAAAAEAVQELARARGRTYLSTACVSPALTGRLCSPYGSCWSTDTASTAIALARTVARQGIRTWYLVVPDTVLGQAVQDDAMRAIEAVGGRVVGRSRHPEEATDFGSVLSQIQASGAQAVGLCDIGGGLAAQLRQFQPSGLFGGDRMVVALLPTIADVHAAGPGAARGLLIASSFYWNQNEQARSFATRFITDAGQVPDAAHAAAYVATRHFLSAVAVTGSIAAEPVGPEMRTEPVYFFGRSGRLRLDGRLAIDLMLLRGKPAEKMATEWDHFDQVGMVPESDIYRPLNQSACPLTR